MKKSYHQNRPLWVHFAGISLFIVAVIVVSIVVFGPRTDTQSWVILIVQAVSGSLVFFETALYFYDYVKAKRVKLPFAPAQDNEHLIIIAKFRGPDHYDAQAYIYDQLFQDSKAHPDLPIRIEKYPECIDGSNIAAESERALELGLEYNAMLVIWGWHDDISITPCYRVIKETSVKTTVTLGEHWGQGVSDLQQFKTYISVKIPEALSCISLLTIGQAYYFSDDYVSAEKLFKQVLALVEGLPLEARPDRIEMPLRFYRATACQSLARKDARNGMLDEAIADYDRVLALIPEHAQTYNNRGNARAKKGELDKAIDDYDRALALNPDLAETYNNRGGTYAAKGDWKKAIGDYDRALELNPEYAEAYYNRGIAHRNRGDLDKAVADYDRALELNPQDVEAYYNQGVAYGDKGEFEKAIGDYDRALELNPKHAEAYYNRGVAYWRKGDLDKAIGDWTRALESNPEDAEAYYNRGVAYQQKGELEKALNDFRQALTLAKDVETRKLIEKELDKLKD